MLTELGEAHDYSLLECQLGNLSDEQRKDMQDFVSQYADILTSRLGITHLLENTIQLKDVRPVKLPPKSLAPPKMFFFLGYIKQILTQAIIGESLSTYSGPFFVEPKGPNNFRSVVDYRLLKRRKPLPDIPSSFNWFAQDRYFSTLFLSQAYNHIH
jgi:hypothetical protein